MRGKRLRRITPAYGRQAACLPAACAWGVLCAGLTTALLLGSGPRGGAAAVDVGLAAMTALMVRCYRIGIYLGPEHVRVRTLLRTRTADRRALTAVSTAPRRPIARTEGPFRSDAITLELADGSRIATPVRVLNTEWERTPFGPVYDLQTVRRVLAQLRDGLPLPRDASP
ncbi:hypothetical protein [Streptacidiphilus rugosus]|uniref:hypothetical protein n=1 Tax=Streptacidiphilus rugosus TaxID=405783 RepID=UPI0005639BE1|nr:hypothetical protein [Streptacidiphilus rugosus]